MHDQRTPREVLEIASWRWAVGDVTSDELPEIACDALLAGLNSPALGMLAGQPVGMPRESRDLFVATLDELGIDVLAETDARRELLRLTARAMIAGAVDPYDGADEIWCLTGIRLEHGQIDWENGTTAEPSRSRALTADDRDLVLQAAAVLADLPARRDWVIGGEVWNCPIQVFVHDDPVHHVLSDLGISQGLTADLEAWAASYALELDAGGPLRAPDEGRLLALDQHGELLRERVRAEAPIQDAVTYLSPRILMEERSLPVKRPLRRLVDAWSRRMGRRG